LITRLIAVVPAIIVIASQGDEGSYGLLILSQAILSLQLPFVVIPLIQFTSDRARLGEFANRRWVQVLAWISATIVVGLNTKPVVNTLGNWTEHAEDNAIWLWATIIPLAIGCGMLLYIALPRSWPHRWKKMLPVPTHNLLSSRRNMRISA